MSNELLIFIYIQQGMVSSMLDGQPRVTSFIAKKKKTKNANAHGNLSF